ncbi:hypothetical protein T265_06518 [Opisthorchis viverrini]|uniref:Uncharacterized protein n=1 Tax=Opisthorchis viverrini TaxID=6198 RepID=A0A074ZS53_OPIVI|nr:hypothetical protein T265_06518 [Opisthorchis viverrini]KER26160.1 hypothetical protein T265_06518 [Opisthorchis viverrini]
MRRSHTPPLWLLNGGVNCHSTLYRISSALMRECESRSMARFNSISAPTKLEPLSLIIFSGAPLRAIKRISALMKESEDNEWAISRCTALICKQRKFRVKHSDPQFYMVEETSRALRWPVPGLLPPNLHTKEISDGPHTDDVSTVDDDKTSARKLQVDPDNFTSVLAGLSHSVFFRSSVQQTMIFHFQNYGQLTTEFTEADKRTGLKQWIRMKLQRPQLFEDVRTFLEDSGLKACDHLVRAY